MTSGPGGMDDRAVTEMPLQLLIIIIVAAISIAGIVGGLYYYSVSTANNNVKLVAEQINQYIINQFGDTGTDKTVDVNVQGSLMHDVEFIKVGDTLLGPDDQEDPFYGFTISWQVAGGDIQSRNIISDAGTAIQVTSNYKDVCEDESSWAHNPLTSEDEFGFTMELREGNYKLRLRSLNWIPMEGEVDDFVMIYIYE